MYNPNTVESIVPASSPQPQLSVTCNMEGPGTKTVEPQLEWT